MKVNDLMSRVVVSAQEKDSMLQVMELLEQHQISGLPVLNDGGMLIGVISRHDLSHPQILSHLNSGESLASLPIDHIKEFKEVITIQESDSIEDAASIMAKHRIHRVVVTNAIGTLIGILTTSDITRLKASDNVTNYDYPNLTDFDKQFIRLLILQKTEKEMAATFHISESDVYEFIYSIQGKLGVRDTNQIVARSLELHIF